MGDDRNDDKEMKGEGEGKGGSMYDVRTKRGGGAKNTLHLWKNTSVHPTPLARPAILLYENWPYMRDGLKSIS